MAEQHTAHHGPSWYKIFCMVLAALFTLFILMLSQCALGLESIDAALNSALCLAYGILALGCVFLGFMVSLVGVEHAKRSHKSHAFYLGTMLYFVVAAIVFFYVKFF